jgi:3-oxo-4-pregnene-20-carboxyl-CoA dehydrogenase alpha subunit
VDFTPDENQRVIARLAGEVLEAHGSPAFEGDFDPAVWKALGHAGLLSLSVPASLGGDGLGVVETAVLLTEIGRRVVPVPALATLALGVLPLVRFGSRQQQRDLLPPIATDGLVLTAALREPSDPMPAVPASTVRGDTVSGTKIGVPYAATAHRILVPVRFTAGGIGVVLIDPAAGGVTLRRTPTAAGTPEYTLALDRAPVDGVLAADPADLYQLALAGAGAVADGVLAGALAMTTAHVGTRQQFGRRLATFQAVAQQIADVYIVARTLHQAVLAACWRLGTGRPAGADLDVAAYWLAEEVPAALRTCHHLHGGLGLDASYPLHRYSSSLRDLVRFVGGSEYRLDRVGAWVA